MDLEFYYHNYSYWVKQILAITIIFSTIQLIKNPRALILNIWLISSVLFILLIFAGLGNQYPFLRSILTLDKSEEIRLDDYLLELSRNMGSSISTYFLAKDYDSAFFLRGPKLIIGENVKKRLLKNELKGIIAHELSHFTRGNIHDMIIFAGMVITSVFYSLFFIKLPFRVSMVVMLACIYSIMSVFLWCRECDCDSNAVKYVLIDDFSSGLSKIYEGKLHSFSFLHPSPYFRINRLKRLYSND